MTTNTPSAAAGRTWVVAGAGLLLFAALAIVWLARSSELPGAVVEAAQQAPERPAAEASSFGGDRVAVTPDEALPVASQSAVARRSFDEIFDELVLLFGRGTVTDGGEQASAIAELVTEMLVAFPDAGQRTLMRVAAMPTPWQSAAGGAGLATARVARVLLDFALQRLAAEPALAAGLPVLVAELVTSMPAAAEMAEFVAQVLVDRPYLGAVHEQSLIELARQASGPLVFLGAPVRSLLLTVWENMQRTTGAPVVADLLAWFADPDGGPLRQAAMQRLLASERYRGLVVEQLIADKDLSGMQEAAMHVVKHLPFRAAMQVVSTLQSANRHANLIGAYAWMSVSNGEQMRGDYEECLADNVMPRHREALIAAVGNASSEDAVAIASARTAFDMDPDPRVRGVAFLALCNRAPTQDVSDCLAVAMQDRNFAKNYNLGYLVTGVRALAQRADRDVNQIDLVTKFLLSQATLQDWDRKKLETVRREYLPR